VIVSTSLYSIDVSFTKDNSVLERVLEIIAGTEKELLIVAFSLDHPEIIDSLNYLVDKGIHVEAIVDNSAIQRTMLLDPAFKVMCDSSDALIHSKFLISDMKHSVISTGNFTLSGLQEGLNSFLFFDSCEIANGLYDFYHAIENGASVNGFAFSNCSFYLLPYANLKEKMLDAMLRAKESIYVAAYAFTDYDFLSVMKLKSIKGIEIRCLVDSWTFNYGEIVSYLNKPFLVRRVGAHKSLHEKTMILDDEIVITGSANLTYSAYEKNRELIVIIKNKGVAKKFLDYFNYIWEVWGDDY
jgi:phosphatidylserine/phosphatidylglycerophosphate/cardiolipin synthase-like enzyme